MWEVPPNLYAPAEASKSRRYATLPKKTPLQIAHTSHKTFLCRVSNLARCIPAWFLDVKVQGASSNKAKFGMARYADLARAVTGKVGNVQGTEAFKALLNVAFEIKL